jgi:hypothetical protein
MRYFAGVDTCQSKPTKPRHRQARISSGTHKES